LNKVTNKEPAVVDGKRELKRQKNRRVKALRDLTEEK
jgi:hypothetical protein